MGWGHSRLNQRGADCEAGYFNQEYPATRGRVGSILIEKLSRCMEFDLNGAFRPSALGKATLSRMREKDRIFVDLRNERWTSVKHRPKKFFSKDGPDYDGVLFIK